MTKRADTAVIEVADPNCRGVTSSDGRVRYDKDRKGRIELPRSEARKILASGHRDARPYRTTVGFSDLEMSPRLLEWLDKSGRAESGVREASDA